MIGPGEKRPEWWANRASTILRSIPEDERFPVDVERLAIEWSPIVDRTAWITKVAGRDLDGCDGALIDARERGKGWGIAFDKGIVSKGRRRFTIAHELGHFLLHRHLAPDGGFRCRPEDLATWDHERSPQEAQANRFAARLLMPLDDLRRHAPAQAAVGLAELGRLADERYGVSLTSCALQWLEITSQRAVLVVSRDGFILWAKSSTPAFRSGAYFRTRGVAPRPIPPASPVSLGLLDPSDEPVRHPAGVWFADEPVVEEVILSDRYDLGLSLLCLDSHGPTADHAEEEVLDAIDLMTDRNGRFGRA